MPELRVHQEKVTPEIAKTLTGLCPFGAMSYENGKIEISSACRMCRLCVRKGPQGVMEFVEDAQAPSVHKDEWKGICVFADMSEGYVHPVTYELIGKARELASVTAQPVYVCLISENAQEEAKKLLTAGVDAVYVYDDPMFRYFAGTTYTNAFEDFINKVKPSSILVGATNLGRSLAPRVAARFRTGLTADCTQLEMKENTDLVQIRPAFGGNIMARIITTNSRPQFATVRYKVFTAPEPVKDPKGSVINMNVDPCWEDKRITITDYKVKPPVEDISEAETIVAVGRGLKSKDDLEKIQAFADKIGAKVAVTRPLVEAGWMDATHQIGLSGKTVKPKLIFTFGISGQVQFVSGMKNSDYIIAVNQDPEAPIFDVAHCCIVGDLYEVLDGLMSHIEEG